MAHFRIIKDQDSGKYYIGYAITEAPAEDYSKQEMYATKQEATPALREIQAADNRFQQQFLAHMRHQGSKGGKARAKSLTAEERRAIGKRAAKARWSKKPGARNA